MNQEYPEQQIYPANENNGAERAADQFQAVDAEKSPDQPPDSRQPGQRLSRRKLLIAGSAAGGLVVASSLGLLELNHLLQQQGADIFGNFLLGANRHQSPLSVQGPITTPDDIVIFSGRLAQGWNDWSWPGKYPVVASPAFTDGSPVIKFTPGNGSGLYLSHALIQTTGFGFFQFWVNGGSVGGQQLLAGTADQTYTFLNEPSINTYIQDGFVQLNQWRLVRIPLAALQSADSTIGGVIIRDGAGAIQPDVFLADLRLVHLPDPNEPVLLSGDAPDLNAVLLFFDRQMRLDDVQSPHFYQISSLEDDSYLRAVHPASAQYHDTNKSVSLLVSNSMKTGKHYFVSVGRIRSMDGPALADASSVTVTAQPLEMTVDISKRGNAISPYIYGVNFPPNAGYMADLRPTINRWGGESVSRYNWKLGNAYNAGSDYYFENGNYGHTSPADRQPSGVADQFIQANQRAGAETILTIPSIGWVAKDDLATTASVNVPGAYLVGPPIRPGSDITLHGYDPTSNRLRTSVPSRARKGAPLADPPNLNDPTVAQDEWVHHLVNRFGSANSGGVRFYSMDNEPELWCILHRDIRPAEISYQQTLDFFLDYATAVKDVDPTALITGPVVWGWPNYFYSALDRGTDNFKALPDYHAHNDTPLLIWWMQQIRQHDEATGRRNLDLLDMHFSPAGINPYDANPIKDTRASWPIRLRSTRLLWDRTYKDEFWVNDYVYLIPRMLGWIAQSYPGTKLAISEYSWGAETLMNGGLAQAEVLGIFGREGLYLACRWPYPAPYSPPYYAFKLYSNYDNQGSSFLGVSIQVTSTRPDTLSGYATEQENGDVLLMLLNKSEQEALTPTIHLPNLAPRTVTAYRYGPDPGKPIAQVDRFTLTDQTLRYTLPPYSITLLKLAKAS